MDEEFAEAPFLTGPIPTIADIACCAYLYWLDEAGLRISDWPGVEKWLGRIAQLPGWFHPDDMPRQSRVFAPGIAAG
ncbi:glutathione S-transferase C-terminal domain-containing protein [Varunaivibrio sulfuroxidans]|uniref:glutathione S-transferase C-terminal domain-containing protein n=1 Tax=Varunaivibrio sulfuroxidans TaxID=1773489 RepID=UPI0038D373B7